MHLDEEVAQLLADIKEQSRRREECTLNPNYAMSSSQSRGRARQESDPPGENRTAFARDRDRILYSKAFFRLSGKTQVFMSPRNPLVSNRMTHTIHVAQLSRAICRALQLNEDLGEAIALGHDTGHPPFGHRGEKILDEMSLRYLRRGFSHNVHGLRMLDVLEKGGRGLNLTYEVRDGIVRHCGEVETGHFVPGEPADDLAARPAAEPSTLEGCVVKICDRIAYVGKDIEDATGSGIISPGDIPDRIASVLGRENSRIIDTLVTDLVVNFQGDRKGFVAGHGREPETREIGIRLSGPVLQALNSLINDFNYPRIYESDANNRYSAQTENMLRYLFGHFLDELDDMGMPEQSQATLERFGASPGAEGGRLADTTLGELEQADSQEAGAIARARGEIIRANLEGFRDSRSSVLHFLAGMEEEYWLHTPNAQIVIDYISLMTDTMATAIFESLTIPRPVV